MKMKLASSFIFLIVLTASGFCEETTTAVSTTTESTTSAQTTTVTDSTSKQPNTTTVSPSTTLPTTSQQPDTTTVSPSTSSTNPSTSTLTVLPVTTTTVKPTTASLPDTTSSPQPTTVTTTKPPEPPTPVDGSWNVTEGNLTCIRADLKIRFKIPVKDHVEYFILSPNATSSGSCKSSNTTQELQLEEREYTLTMIFEKDSDNAYLKNVTLSFTLPDSSGMVYRDTKLFNVKVGNSYMCDSLNNIDLKNVTMEVFHIHIQSFGTVGDKDFGTAEKCDADIKIDPMISPAVGIVLLVLVVVLVGYFVESRRSRQKGYRSEI